MSINYNLNNTVSECIYIFLQVFVLWISFQMLLLSRSCALLFLIWVHLIVDTLLIYYQLGSYFGEWYSHFKHYLNLDKKKIV